MQISDTKLPTPDNRQRRRCAVWLTPETDGGYSASVPSLPGVHSQGDSVAEAVLHVEDALAAAIESYQAASEPVPWRQAPSNPPPGVVSRWIEIDG